MDNVEQILTEWPLTAGTDDTVGAQVTVSTYHPPHFLTEQRANIRQYQTIAPTPELEMQRWLQIVESWLNSIEKKKKKTMLTEVDPLAQQKPIEGPQEMMPGESALFEIDPIAHQQPLHTKTTKTTETTETTYANPLIPIDQQLRDQTIRQVNGQARTQPFWHEVDPTTGKPVDPEKSSHPLNGEMAGWKVI